MLCTRLVEGLEAEDWNWLLMVKIVIQWRCSGDRSDVLARPQGVSFMWECPFMRTLTSSNTAGKYRLRPTDPMDRVHKEKTTSYLNLLEIHVWSIQPCRWSLTAGKTPCCEITHSSPRLSVKPGLKTNPWRYSHSYVPWKTWLVRVLVNHVSPGERSSLQTREPINVMGNMRWFRESTLVRWQGDWQHVRPAWSNNGHLL